MRWDAGVEMWAPSHTLQQYCWGLRMHDALMVQAGEFFSLVEQKDGIIGKVGAGHNAVPVRHCRVGGFGSHPPCSACTHWWFAAFAVYR